MKRIFTRGPILDRDVELTGLAGLFVVVLGPISLLAIFTASTTTGVLVSFAIAASLMLAVVLYRNEGSFTPPIVLLIVAALWATFGGIIVFETHMLAFTPAAWVFSALLVATALLALRAQIATWLKLLAGLHAVSICCAVAVLPRPPGGEGSFDTAEKWRVNVLVRDSASVPLKGASVLCGAVLTWNRDYMLDTARTRTTQDDGRVWSWEFNEDPRMKIVICSASKDSNDGNAGYPKVVRLVLSPSEGGDYNLEFALRENAHPEVAFLAVDVDGTYNQGWYSLDFELWGRKPVGRFGKSGGPQPLESKSLGDLAGSGFAIPAASATRDLRVRYRYEGTRPQDFGPPYREVLTIRVGAIKPGTRRHIRLTIPQQ